MIDSEEKHSECDDMVLSPHLFVHAVTELHVLSQTLAAVFQVHT